MLQGITSLAAFAAYFTEIGDAELSESKLRTQSIAFAVAIINLVNALKKKRETIISNQIGRSGTSIFTKGNADHPGRESILQCIQKRTPAEPF